MQFQNNNHSNNTCNNNSRRVSLDVSHPSNRVSAVPTVTTSSDPSATPMIMMPTGSVPSPAPSSMNPSPPPPPPPPMWHSQSSYASNNNTMNQLHPHHSYCDNNRGGADTPTDMMEPILPIPPVSFFPSNAGGNNNGASSSSRMSRSQQQQQQQQHVPMQHRRASAPGFYGNMEGDSPYAPSHAHMQHRKVSLPFASNHDMMAMSSHSESSGMRSRMSASPYAMHHGHEGGMGMNHMNAMNMNNMNMNNGMDDSTHSASHYNTMNQVSNHSRRASMGTNHMGNNSSRGSGFSSRRASMGMMEQHSSTYSDFCPPPPSYMQQSRPPPPAPSSVLRTISETHSTSDSPKAMRPRPPGMLSFPTKLHQILNHPDYQDYIRWMPHGRSWRILKAKAFEVQVLPKHFRSARYASFMRQVNGWGFRRITEGPDLNAYFHPCFVKGMPELCEDMRRPQKGQNPLEWSEDYPDKNPDFYKIQALAPLPTSSPVKPSEEKETQEENEVEEEEGVANLVAMPLEEKRANRKRKNQELAADTAQEVTEHDEDEEDDSPMMPPIQPAYTLCDFDNNSVASWGDDFSDAHAADDETVRQDVFGTSTRDMNSPPRKIRIGGTRAAPPSTVSTGTSSASTTPMRASSPPNTLDSNNKNHLIAPSLSELSDDVPSLSSSGGSGAALSKADLSYLAYQNKLLLRQTQLLQRQKEKQPTASTGTIKKTTTSKASSCPVEKKD